MDINYELYKVFYYVATTLSFSEASRYLFISQSAVSQSIKALEKKLGQPLFIRSTKKVKLTPAGELLLKHVEPAIQLIGHGEAQLMESQSLGLGQLHIGASDTICRYFLVPYLNEFHKKIPHRPHQGDKRHLPGLRRPAGTGQGRPDRDQRAQSAPEPVLYRKNGGGIPRCLYRQSRLFSFCRG